MECDYEYDGDGLAASKALPCSDALDGPQHKCRHDCPISRIYDDVYR